MLQDGQQTILTAKGDENYGEKIINYAKLAKRLVHKGKYHLLGLAYERKFPDEAKSL